MAIFADNSQGFPLEGSLLTLEAHQVRVPAFAWRRDRRRLSELRASRDAETPPRLVNFYEKTVRGYSSTCHFISRVP
jgi:hypothetical protein